VCWHGLPLMQHHLCCVPSKDLAENSLPAGGCARSTWLLAARPTNHLPGCPHLPPCLTPPGHPLADFVAEGLDQTRGWFYTLMVLSTALFDKPAFKNLVCNGLVLAADGKKMSKRLKNYPVSLGRCIGGAAACLPACLLSMCML
jgi:hypothetical protein